GDALDARHAFDGIKHRLEDVDGIDLAGRTHQLRGGEDVVAEGAATEVGDLLLGRDAGLLEDLERVDQFLASRDVHTNQLVTGMTGRGPPKYGVSDSANEPPSRPKAMTKPTMQRMTPSSL